MYEKPGEDLARLLLLTILYLLGTKVDILEL